MRSRLNEAQPPVGLLPLARSISKLRNDPCVACLPFAVGYLLRWRCHWISSALPVTACAIARAACAACTTSLVDACACAACAP
jgi:hypothetical protein